MHFDTTPPTYERSAIVIIDIERFQWKLSQSRTYIAITLTELECNGDSIGLKSSPI